MGTKDKDTKVRTHYAAHSIRAKAASSTPLNRSPAPVPESSATSPSIPTATSSGGKSGKGKGRAIPPLVGTSKLVYKGLVESPNVIRWPATLPNHLQTTLLHTICSLLDGCAQHHVAKSRASKSTRKASSKRSMIHLSEEELLNEGPSLSTTPKLDGRPKILDHLVLGLNGVTKELSSLPYSSSTNEAPDTVAYVFVCHPDISPPSLVAHLPALCAVYNGKLIARGRSKDLGLRLVSLGKGAEYVLAQALGLRRVGVLAFKSSLPSSQHLTFLNLLQAHSQPIFVPHLVPRPPTPSTLIPTARSTSPLPTLLAPLVVKRIATTTPSDPKGQKLGRIVGVKKRKEERKEEGRAKGRTRRGKVGRAGKAREAFEVVVAGTQEGGGDVKAKSAKRSASSATGKEAKKRKVDG